MVGGEEFLLLTALLFPGVLRIIFGPKIDGIMGCWKKLHNKELNFYSSHIIRSVKSRKMR
jgi:hypothetical protein